MKLFWSNVIFIGWFLLWISVYYLFYIKKSYTLMCFALQNLHFNRNWIRYEFKHEMLNNNTHCFLSHFFSWLDLLLHVSAYRHLTKKKRVVSTWHTLAHTHDRAQSGVVTPPSLTPHCTWGTAGLCPLISRTLRVWMAFVTHKPRPECHRLPSCWLRRLTTKCKGVSSPLRCVWVFVVDFCVAIQRLLLGSIFKSLFSLSLYVVTGAWHLLSEWNFFSWGFFLWKVVLMLWLV